MLLTTSHTIISTDIIKPSSPTPPHLKTYNLSLIDQTIGASNFIPIVTFYKNTNNTSFHDITLDLKNSLSQTLINYYPFAGRHARTAPAVVECNDEGVEFLVGSLDSTLSDFLKNSQHEELNQLFPYEQVWYHTTRKSESEQVVPLAVQINRFKCGGVAIATSLSHKIADASGGFHFLHDWSKMTRVISKKSKQPEPKQPEQPEQQEQPVFIHHPYRNLNFNAFSREGARECVTKRFVFPNTKINNLRLEVKALSAKSGNPIANPTRVDVLTWLISKCAMDAASRSNSGIFAPTSVYPSINIRSGLTEPLPEKSIGNYIMVMEVTTKNKSEMSPEWFISELQKQKMKYRNVRNLEAMYDLLPNTSSESAKEEHQNKIDASYFFSSLCWNSPYKIDFGWGKPEKVTLAGGLRNFSVLLETPNDDGIEAIVCLEKTDMEFFQSDPELLAFC